VFPRIGDVVRRTMRHGWNSTLLLNMSDAGLTPFAETFGTKAQSDRRLRADG
jgi:hypothetical protein